MKSYVFGIKILEYIICIKLIGIYMNNVNEVIYILITCTTTIEIYLVFYKKNLHITCMAAYMFASICHIDTVSNNIVNEFTSLAFGRHRHPIA